MDTSIQDKVDEGGSGVRFKTSRLLPEDKALFMIIFCRFYQYLRLTLMHGDFLFHGDDNITQCTRVGVV